MGFQTEYKLPFPPEKCELWKSNGGTYSCISCVFLYYTFN